MNSFRVSITLALLALSLNALAQSAEAQKPEASAGTKSAVVLASDTSITIAEVRVTASEVRGAQTSTSLIGPTAMEHLQPASLSDVLSLLPGGLTETPKMGQANTLSLREIPSSDENYATSALGTRINIDGAPLGADANMQRITDAGQTDSDVDRTSVNKGVDLRSIPTDEIESVEVIRGIPSVRYGDITSGVVNVTRRLSDSPVTIRFKADPYSRLVSIAKGFDAPRGWTVAAGAGFLSSEVDPRCEYETYKRVNASLRGSKMWFSANGLSLTWKPVIDYSQNVDDDKADPEQQVGADDKFRSSYIRFSLSNKLAFRWNQWSLDFQQSASLSSDKTEQWMRYVNTQNLYAPSDTVDGLPHDVVPLEHDYVAHHLVDGRPFYSNIQLGLSHKFSATEVVNLVSLGGEWQCNKNYGRGQVFDASRPLHGSTSRRPRSFRSVPATNIIGIYAEDEFSSRLGLVSARLTFGVRATMMAGLGSDYAMSGKMYVDPRANLTLASPNFGSNRNASITLTLGAGRLCKMPTMDQLHPDRLYVELTELNYWNKDENLCRRITRTYALNLDSYDLQPAHNVKIEARLAARVARHSASVTIFRETMDDGFRYVQTPVSLAYNKYDASGLVGSSLTSKPDTSGLPCESTARLRLVRKTVNASRTRKEGIEWQYDSPRLPRLHTRLSVCGAWLRTTRENSEPEWYQGANATVLGVVVDEYYAGLYDWHQTTLNNRTSTNFTVETVIPRIGFIFSATAECVWHSEKTTPLRNAQPISYVSTDGIVRDYTVESAADPVLSQLILSNTTTSLTTTERPYATFNFKATKEFGTHFSLSFFADRLLAAARDYEKNGFVVRRTFSPYFGMQAYLKFL